jgi:hypothetical protein
VRAKVLLTAAALAALSIGPLYTAWIAVRYIAREVAGGAVLQYGWGLAAICGLVLVGLAGWVGAVGLVRGSAWAWWLGLVAVAAFIVSFGGRAAVNRNVGGVYVSVLLALPVLAGLVTESVRVHCGVVGRSAGGRPGLTPLRGRGGPNSLRGRR